MMQSNIEDYIYSLLNQKIEKLAGVASCFYFHRYKKEYFVNVSRLTFIEKNITKQQSYLQDIWSIIKPHFLENNCDLVLENITKGIERNEYEDHVAKLQTLLEEKEHYEKQVELQKQVVSFIALYDTNVDGRDFD